MPDPQDLLRLLRLGTHHAGVQSGLVGFDHHDPYDAFTAWYADAVRHEPDVPDAMQLATATPGGAPTVRTVLLKGLARETGLQFFTNLGSRKAHQMAENPHVAVVFHWKTLARQVHVEGIVRPVAPETADAYFASRPRGSQIGAWASDQSRPLNDRAELERRTAEVEARFHGVDVPRPDGWSGFDIVPRRWEFWQGRTSRLHDRWAFERDGDAWTRGLLFP